MRYSDLVRVCGSSIAESVKDAIRVFAMTKSVFTELDALGDGFAEVIYLRKQIIGRCSRAMGHPWKACCHVGDVEFGNSTRDGVWGSQIESGPGGDAALEGGGAGSRVPWIRDLREASKGEGEVGGRLHRSSDVGGEDDTGVGCLRSLSAKYDRQLYS